MGYNQNINYNNPNNNPMLSPEVQNPQNINNLNNNKQLCRGVCGFVGCMSLCCGIYFLLCIIIIVILILCDFKLFGNGAASD